MKLNLDFYNGKDEYSDGDIENTILNYINKYPENYEKSFKYDNSWPVFYHLSDIRQNSIRWYPFKKGCSILEIGGGMGAITTELCKKASNVTSIELSKRRATAILNRNKKCKNLEIIVGNYKDIKLTQKYDYILLNGVLEYAAFYVDTNNPFEDFINSIKSKLKKDGKILIAIENRFGLKYWCGAKEDHTSIKFDGLNNYPSGNKVRTFNKTELERLFDKCDLKYNFYYMFPDYKFPQLILTDKSLGGEFSKSYLPYCSQKTDFFINELNVFKQIDVNMIPFVANSFFVELSEKKSNIDIEYVKYNIYRNKEENIFTYKKGDCFYKQNIYDEGNRQLEIINSNYKLLHKLGIKTDEIKYNSTIQSKRVDGISLNVIALNHYYANQINEIYNIFDDLYELIMKSCGKKVNSKNNIFSKYNIKVPDKFLNSEIFYENGFLDLTLENVIKDNNEDLIVIDQEWYENNVPAKFILYRAIRNFINQINCDNNIKKCLFNKYNIEENYYLKLDDKFLSSKKSDEFKFYNQYSLNVNNVDYENYIDKCLNDSNIIINNQYDEIVRINNEYGKLTKEIKRVNDEFSKYFELYNNMCNEYLELKNKYDSIITSKRWKLFGYRRDKFNNKSK